MDTIYIYKIIHIFQIAYLKNGKIIFNEKVEKIQQMSPPTKSIDIIIEDLYTSIISNLQVNNYFNTLLFITSH